MQESEMVMAVGFDISDEQAVRLFEKQAIAFGTDLLLIPSSWPNRLHERSRQGAFNCMVFGPGERNDECWLDTLQATLFSFLTQGLICLDYEDVRTLYLDYGPFGIAVFESDDYNDICDQLDRWMELSPLK